MFSISQQFKSAQIQNQGEALGDSFPAESTQENGAASSLFINRTQSSHNTQNRAPARFQDYYLSNQRSPDHQTVDQIEAKLNQSEKRGLINRKLTKCTDQVVVHRYVDGSIRASRSFLTADKAEIYARKNKKSGGKKAQTWADMRPEDREKSARRARTNLNHTVNQLCIMPGQDTFVTFTMQDEKYQDRALAIEAWTKFIKKMNRNRKEKGLQPLHYVCVAERQKRGVWHFHAIMKGSFKYHNFHKQWKEIIGCKGYVDTSAVRSPKGLRRYLGKTLSNYMAKELALPESELASRKAGERKYMKSQGIPKPEKYVFYFPVSLDPYHLIRFIEQVFNTHLYDIGIPREAGFSIYETNRN